MHASICDIIADVVQNAIEAKASQVTLEICTGSETLHVRVTDNGKGMDATTMAKAMDPFTSEAGKHDHRKVGLGLPFLRQTVDAVNGKLEIQSEPGKGTTVSFYLDAHHVDLPPFGDLPGTVLGLMTFGNTYNLTIKRKTHSDGYTISRQELCDTLGDLDSALNLTLARDFLTEQERALTH